MAALAVLLIASACGSGPSDAALAAQRIPTTTTTTEPPPEGLVFITISNGSFQPSNLQLDLTKEWIVQWRHEDTAEREYVLTARNGEFESGPLNTGDIFEFDFSSVDPGIYRYFAILGLTRVVGFIDTRPKQ